MYLSTLTKWDRPFEQHSPDAYATCNVTSSKGREKGVRMRRGDS